jgi:hypothetical protein
MRTAERHVRRPSHLGADHGCVLDFPVAWDDIDGAAGAFLCALSRTTAENPEGTVTPAAHCLISARMAELADALRSGRSSRKGVEVRALFRAPIL